MKLKVHESGRLTIIPKEEEEAIFPLEYFAGSYVKGVYTGDIYQIVLFKDKHYFSDIETGVMDSCPIEELDKDSLDCYTLFKATVGAFEGEFDGKFNNTLQID